MPDIVSPIDGQVAFSYDELETSAALAKVERAHAVQAKWCKVPVSERAAVCRRMLAAYAAQLPDFAEQITRMMGKPVSQARAEFQRGMQERVEYLCDIAQAALADETLPARTGFRRYIRHEPVGVVLDIAAWNYPLLIATNVIVPAVLSGNAVLVKHSGKTALVAEQFEQVFRNAGAPAGLVQAFHVSHHVVAEVLDRRRIGYVSFTGSVRGGHEVYQTVAKHNFVGVGLELGGKDPALVLDDADFDFTVENLVDGSFYNAGQSCCAVERIYVVESLFDRFVQAFAAKTREYMLGNPLDEGTTLGPLVNEAAVRHVQDQVDRAVSGGARIVIGSKHFRVPDLSPCYMAPHVLVDVNHDMDLMTEETFGPAIGIMKVKNEVDGVAMMNDSKYGLTASIWTRDHGVGQSLAEQVEAGTVYVNRCDYLDPGLAWTGVKDSGFGCSLSRLGFLQVTRPKSFNVRIVDRGA